MIEIKAKAFASHVSRGKLHPVYLLVGEEALLIDKALARLIDAALDEGARDFNMDLYYGLDSDAGDIAMQARALPMMAKRRVVVVKEYDRLRNTAPVESYAQSPSETTVLILVAAGADRGKTKTLAKALGGSGAMAHFYHPFESELPGWVRSLAGEAGYTIDTDAAGYLVAVLGNNLALIEAELNKVYNFLGERKSITLRDVEDSVGDFGMPAVFDFVDAVARGNTEKALYTLDRLLGDGKQHPVMILGMMAQRWRKLIDAKQRLARGDGPEKLRAAFRLNYKNEKEFIEQVRKNSEVELLGAFRLFCRADRDLKGDSGLSPKAVMERLIIEVTDITGAVDATA